MFNPSRKTLIEGTVARFDLEFSPAAESRDAAVARKFRQE
jgi:hypothetical protein